jgi:hypothetical protein
MIVGRMVRWSLVTGMLVAALAGCATTDTQPSATVTSLNPQASRSFKVVWEAGPERDGERRLQGYVESSLGEAATRVQLLALALDASGNVTAQRVAWLPESIPGGGRAYFDIPKMPTAPEYRVSVWSFDRLKGGSM